MSCTTRNCKLLSNELLITFFVISFRFNRQPHKCQRNETGKSLFTKRRRDVKLPTHFGTATCSRIQGNISLQSVWRRTLINHDYREFKCIFFAGKRPTRETITKIHNKHDRGSRYQLISNYSQSSSHFHLIQRQSYYKFYELSMPIDFRIQFLGFQEMWGKTARIETLTLREHELTR